VSSAGVTALIFAVYRELLATAGFFLLAWVSSALKAAGLGDRPYIPRREDWWRFLVMGFCSFGNVVGFIIGLHLTSAPSAAAFQPAIPVASTVFSVLAGQERLSLQKATGVLLSAAGATTSE